MPSTISPDWARSGGRSHAGLALAKADGTIDPAPSRRRGSPALTNSPKLPISVGRAAIRGCAGSDCRRSGLATHGRSPLVRAKEQVTRLHRIDGSRRQDVTLRLHDRPVADLAGNAIDRDPRTAPLSSSRRGDQGRRSCRDQGRHDSVQRFHADDRDRVVASRGDYLRSIPTPESAQGTAAWTQAYVNARKARENYLAIYSTSPVPCSRRWRKHTTSSRLPSPIPSGNTRPSRLPSRTSPIKAKAANDAFENARAEERKAKATAAADKQLNGIYA